MSVLALRRLARMEADGLCTVNASLAPAADPGCYGCLGTGRLRWAGVRPVPCSCVTDPGEDQ